MFWLCSHLLIQSGALELLPLWAVVTTPHPILSGFVLVPYCSYWVCPLFCFLNLQLNTCPSSPLLCLCVRDCLQQVVSIEKMEDTSLLPNPIIVSIRSKMAFQFIELRDRDSLVEGLLARLKLVHADKPVHYDTTVDEDLV